MATDTKAQTTKEPVEIPSTKGEIPDPDDKNCSSYLFQPKIDDRPLPFVPFIPTIIAITLFVYGWVTSTSSEGSTPTTSLKGCYTFYIIAFFIVFMQAFSNMFDSQWWEHYNKMIKSKGTVEGIFWTIRIIVSECIEPINGKIKLGPIPVGWVQYFNFPFNYLIFTGILIAICIAFMSNIVLFEKKHGEDDPKNNRFFTFNVMKNKTPGDGGAFSLLQGGLAIVGIIYAIFTNWFIMKGIDPDEAIHFSRIFLPSKPKKPVPWGGKRSEFARLAYIIRLFKWAFGLFSVVILTYYYSLWSSTGVSPMNN